VSFVSKEKQLHGLKQKESVEFVGEE